MRIVVHLDGSLFPPLFREVRTVQEAIRTYCLPGDAIPLPKENLRQAIEHVYGVRIIIRTLPLKTRLLRGMIEMYDDKSIVYIDGSLNSAWTRYVYAKEVCHHLLDSEEYYTTDVVDLIEYFVLDGREIEQEVEGSAESRKDIEAEYLTKFAAIELLFPFEMREGCKTEIAAGVKTAYQIAEHFDIPEHLVEYALSDFYMDYARRVWDAV